MQSNDASKVVPLVTAERARTPARRKPDQSYPRISETEEVERKLESVGATLRNLALSRTGEYGHLTRNRINEAINEAISVLDLVISERLLDRVDDLSEPATEAEIAKELGKLILSDPRDDIADPHIYVPALEEDVGSLAPSRYAIEAGCRKLRRNLRFRPKISEVYLAVKDADEVFQKAVIGLKCLGSQIEDAKEYLQRWDANIQRLRLCEQEEAQREHKRKRSIEIRRRMKIGGSLKGFDQDEINEVYSIDAFFESKKPRPA